MPLDAEYMLRTTWESEERMMYNSSTSCEGAYEPQPTSYYEAYEPSTSNWYQPDGDFGQENHWRHGEEYQPWNTEQQPWNEEYQPWNTEQQHWEHGEEYQPWRTEYHYEEPCPPPSYDEENVCNMLKMILESQREGMDKIDEINKDIVSSLDRFTTHVESLNNNYTQEIEEQEEVSLPLYNNNSYEAHTTYMECDFEEDAQLEDEFQQQAEESIHKFESFYECTEDEDLIPRPEEQTETVTYKMYYTYIDDEEVSLVGSFCENLFDDNLDVEPIEETRESLILKDKLPYEEPTHVIHFAKEEEKGEDSKENQMILNEAFSKDVQQEESPQDKPFENHFGILPFKELKVDDPRKILYEEIRMTEFRGWFYDEYDPGDPYYGEIAFCGLSFT